MPADISRTKRLASVLPAEGLFPFGHVLQAAQQQKLVYWLAILLSTIMILNRMQFNCVSLFIILGIDDSFILNFVQLGTTMLPAGILIVFTMFYCDII